MEGLGCLYACVCGDNCLCCQEYRQEPYVGAAEDYADRTFEEN